MLDGPPQVSVALYPQPSHQMDESRVGLAERVLRGAIDRLDEAGLVEVTGLYAHLPKSTEERGPRFHTSKRRKGRLCLTKLLLAGGSSSRHRRHCSCSDSSIRRIPS